MKEVKLKVLGTVEQDTAKIVVRELELPISPEEFLVVYKKKVKDELKNPALMPGAKELLLHLHKHNIPMGVATSASQAATEVKTKHLQDLFKVFNHIVCGSSDPDVKQGKPAPDIFLVCASRFLDKPDPSQVSVENICLQMSGHYLGKTLLWYKHCVYTYQKRIASFC